VKLFWIGVGAGLIVAAGVFGIAVATKAVLVAPPETCYLGFPNSDNTTVFQLTGTDAWDVCDNLTNPIRQVNALQGAQALAGNTWAPRKICTFDEYGLTWTIWWTDKLTDASGVSSYCFAV
jgi:hypothetical protein